MQDELIDWARIEELHDEVGAEDFIEIATLFLSELEETLAGLSSVSDDVALSEAFHGMKGSALNLGFVSLAQSCAQGEAKPDEVAPHLLGEALARAKDALTTRYPGIAT